MAWGVRRTGWRGDPKGREHLMTGHSAGSRFLAVVIAWATLAAVSALRAGEPAPAAGPSPGDPLSSAVNHSLEFAARQIDLATRSISTTHYPNTTNSSGDWSTTGAGDWTSGFFPGCLWLMYDWSGDPGWRT